MPAFDSLNDDQIALLGCGVALLLCGGGMVLSYTLRRWVTGTSRNTNGGRNDAAASTDLHVAQEDPDQRRAA